MSSNRNGIDEGNFLFGIDKFDEKGSIQDGVAPEVAEWWDDKSVASINSAFKSAVNAEQDINAEWYSAMKIEFGHGSEHKDNAITQLLSKIQADPEKYGLAMGDGLSLVDEDGVNNALPKIDAQGFKQTIEERHEQMSDPTSRI